MNVVFLSEHTVVFKITIILLSTKELSNDPCSYCHLRDLSSVRLIILKQKVWKNIQMKLREKVHSLHLNK